MHQKKGGFVWDVARRHVAGHPGALPAAFITVALLGPFTHRKEAAEGGAGAVAASVAAAAVATPTAAVTWEAVVPAEG